MGGTIAAQATARGEGGIAIVRISGDRAGEILTLLTGKKRLEDRKMFYGHVRDGRGEVLDEVMAVYMAAPRTYTREDTAELYCHGGYAAADSVLARAFECGARAAQSGEFTRRAFENGRIDLSQAEAVMQLIGAGSESAMRSAVRQLDGGVSAFVKRVCDILLGALSLIEASTDFPEEIDEEEAASKVLPETEEACALLRQNIRPDSARFVRDGVNIVLTGKPNVGKSSIMNLLLGHDRAIVTDVAGTTRDVITEETHIAGVKVILSDTAGIRESSDAIERIGVSLAEDAVRKADIVIRVLDASEEAEDIAGNADGRTITLVNKSDLARRLPAIENEIEFSCVTGQGLDEFKRILSERISGGIYPDACLVAQRHIESAQASLKALERGCGAIRQGLALDAVTMDIKEALDRLYEITGENATEDVIDRVFRDFCVGK